MARAWDRLSPAYQKRLERAGVSRSEYERGISLAKARGHETTPERPERAHKHPEKYKKYLKERRKAYAAAKANMIKHFGKAPYVSKMTKTQAEWTANADYHSLVRKASKQYKGNPWYYH